MDGPKDPRQRVPVAGPRPRSPRVTLDYPLPPTVRRVAPYDAYFRSRYGCHIYLQGDGRWRACNNRRTCRECVKEESMKTTAMKVREALSDHFGPAHLQPLSDTDSLFPTEPLPDVGRALGDDDDRHEMLECLEREFEVNLPDAIASGKPSIQDLAGLIDVLVASRDASDR